MTRQLGVWVGLCLLGLAAAACGEAFESAPGSGDSGASSGGSGGSGADTNCSPGQAVTCYEGPDGTEGVGIVRMAP